MAITVTNKYTEENGAPGSPFVTASSIAFSNNKLYLVSLYVPGDVCTFSAITGGGITWVKITAASVLDTGPSNNAGAAMFRGMVTSGATTGALTCTHDGASLLYISVEEVDGMDTTGTNGSGAIVQGGTGNGDTPGTTSTVSLSAFGDAANNAAYSYTGTDNSGDITNEGGYTELCDFGTFSQFQTQWKIGQDTSVTTTFATSAWLSGAVEIKVAAPAVPPTPIQRVGVGRRAGN